MHSATAELDRRAALAAVEAWARYVEEVMRHTSEASQALLRARTFTEILEVQAKLLRENKLAFLDQSVRIAEWASRMATRPRESVEGCEFGAAPGLGSATARRALARLNT